MTPPWIDLIEDLDAAEHDQLLASLPSGHAFFAGAHFGFWAHDGQQPDPNDARFHSWRTWVIMAGRGFGKTLAGAHWITAQVAQGAGTAEPLAIALVGATIEDARRVMVEGRSGLLTVAADWISGWHPSLNQLIFRTGAIATLFSGASPDRLRGPEHHLAWCDELAKWERAADSWDMLQLGLRLGERPRALITTTPKAGPLLAAIVAEPDTLLTGGSTAANPHTPAAFKTRVYDLYAGTRLGAQELDGQLLTDTPGALWTVELLEKCRKKEPPPTPPRSLGGESEGNDPAQPHSPPALAGGAGGGTSSCPYFSPPDQSTTLIRVVIGVDPPIADGTCGIVACALDDEGIAHVLADHSVTARTPEGWASAVAAAAAIHGRYFPLSKRGEPPLNPPRNGEGDHAEHGGGVGGGIADAASFARFRPHRRAFGAPPPRSGEDLTPIPVQIVAETNQGGRMVKAILLTADPHLHVKPVTASLSKSDRATPIAHLFEAGKVLLHGRFPELEAQLCGLIAGGGYEGPGASPDRADAMVWALGELCFKGKGGPRVRVV